jgi:pimeloyl-ACP methyl ester carboxylesterase
MTGFIVEGYPAYAYTGGRAFDPALPAVVFVHGAAFDHSVWQWQSRYLAHHGLAALAVDLPGHGRSPGPARHTIGALADWVAAFIEAATLEHAAVVGHSMGSLVALETALRFPRRVSRLALIGISVPMPVSEPFLAAAADDSPAAFDMEAVWGHGRPALLASSPVPGAWLPGASRALNGRAQRGVLHADLHACQAYAPDIEALRRIAMPTLVVGGRRDVMTPPRMGQALAREIPGARFVALDAGHSMMSEAPRAVLGALREFLA